MADRSNCVVRAGLAVAVATGVTLAGAPQWELGVIARDESLRGAAGRAFLAAYLDRCLPVTTGQGAAACTAHFRLDTS